MTPDSFCKTIELEPDQLCGNLGGLDISRPVTPINITETSERALYDERKNCTTECRVSLVQDGTFKGNSAVLLVFRFTFFFDSRSSRRIVKAGINMSFNKIPNSAMEIGPDACGPVVVDYCPALLEGTITTVKRIREKYREIPLGVNVPPIPLQTGLNYGVAIKEEYIEDCKIKIEGLASGSGERSELHRVKWTVEENRALKEGIPSSFLVAVVVQNGGLPIQGTLKLDAYSGRRRLLGAPWTAKQPLVIDPSVAFGDRLGISQFEGLNEGDWKRLINADFALSVFRPSSSRYSSS